jgi:hypothetical protein
MTEIELARRLEKLERDNRRLKGIGIAALVLAAALGAIAATSPVPEKITAHEFEVVDGNGRTRAILEAVNPSGTTLTFLDSIGRKRVILAGGTGRVGNTYGYLELGEDAATEQYVLTTAGGHGGVTLSDGGLMMQAYPLSEGNGSVLLQGPGAGGPTLELTDSKGFTMDIGTAGTETPHTGATQQTSAASIIMFGNDKNHRVIWRAP